MMIPKQLKDLRFNRVRFKEKRAFEPGWQKNTYTYEEIQNYFPQENYGVICNKEVRVLDDDTQKKGLINLFLENFGETFRVRDHLYFKFDNGHSKKIIFQSNKVKFDDGKGGLTSHMGELQGEGTYVVGAGSTHPSGEIYEQKNDLEIITISFEKFKKVFGEYFIENAIKKSTEIKYNVDDDKFIKVIKKEWSVGNRESLALSVAGYLRKEKRLGLDSSLSIIEKICIDCGDEEINSRLQAVRATYDKDEKDIKGITGLKENNIIKENPYAIFGVKGQVCAFYKMQPFFYDKVKTFHLWIKEEGRWESCDKIDMLNILEKNIPHIDTVNSKSKAEILTALEQIGRQKKPEDIPKTWIQFKNKIVDVITGEEFQPSPKYYTTNPIPWDLGESSNTPTIDKLINEWVVDDKYQSESYIKTMKQIMAYTISSDQFLQRLVALCGAGMNGKGTFLKLLGKFVGDNNLCSSDVRILSSNDFEMGSLYKKLCCVMGEVDSEDLKNTNTIKKLSGEDKMRYEFKGKGAFSDDSITTCIIATNSLPTTPDKSLGFYRRWLIIDFPHQFSVKRDLIGQIPYEEYENLGRKCLELLKEMYHTNSFENEGELNQRMDKYEERSNPIIRFIETECDEDFEKKIEVKKFCNNFNNYLKIRHLRVKSAKQITKMLKEEGFEIGPRKIFIGFEQISVRCIIGLAFKTTITTITTENPSCFTREETSSENCSNRSNCSFDKKQEKLK